MKRAHAQKWDKVSKGDYAIFSHSSNIFASFRVIHKIHSVQLANFLWGKDDDNQTWEYIYFLADYKSLCVSYREFNKIVGYKPNYVIQGFNVLDDERANAFLYKYVLLNKRTSVDEETAKDDCASFVSIIIKEKTTPPNINVNNFPIGTLVKHNKFGAGKIIKYGEDGDWVDILFENVGLKTLVTSMNLETINNGT